MIRLIYIFGWFVRSLKRSNLSDIELWHLHSLTIRFNHRRLTVHRVHGFIRWLASALAFSLLTLYLHCYYPLTWLYCLPMCFAQLFEFFPQSLGSLWYLDYYLILHLHLQYLISNFTAYIYFALSILRTWGLMQKLLRLIIMLSH